jgi:extracellular factor (EF) 3-hydroxypalmitic acid methyl ester biosynthesis protein
MDSKALGSISHDGVVTCQDNNGFDVRGTLLRFTPYQAAFEVYAPSSLLRMSESLKDFKIILNQQTIYSGRAVVSNLVNTGEVLVCEVTLDEGWMQVVPVFNNGHDHLSSSFNAFLQQWQRNYKVSPEFKVVVADMRSLLADMRLWLGQIELAIRSLPNGNREQIERETAGELAEPILSAIDSLGDRFEEIASRLEPDLRPAHVHFTRRNLHSLLLCSPFSYRTFYKPLGYAGDYEMVNMILQNPYEGASLFAKVVNAWFLNQLPAQGHRNRIISLKQKLVEETARIVRSKQRPAQIFNLGCGPATEIQNFLREEEISDKARFTLLDFNDETIQYTTGALQETAKQFRRHTPVQMQKKSVQQLLRDAARSAGDTGSGKYDFLYCAGLFDYLPDPVCKQLIGLFYQWLAPGGSLLVTNVDCTRPFRNKLEFILDWNLIYRTGPELAKLRPGSVSADNFSVTSDLTSVNVFLEIRKPENA